MTHNPLINETLLQMKFARVVSLLAKRLGITEEEALQNMSDAYLVDDIVTGMKS